LNKTINTIFEDKPFTTTDDIFNKLHIVSRRPTDLTTICDIKFMYTPYKKILKYKYDFAIKLVHGTIKKNKFSKNYVD